MGEIRDKFAQNVIKYVEAKKYKFSPCPSNMVAFLMHKGLIKESLLFSQRMELEKEFYEWCENGGKETAKDKC